MIKNTKLIGRSKIIKNFRYFNSKFFNSVSSSDSQALPLRLKKKFYNNVDIIEIKNDNFNNENKNISDLKHNYYQILLDGRKCKSMYLDEFKIPNKLLASALAQEWSKQKEYVNLYSMHLVYIYYNLFNQNFYASTGIRLRKDQTLLNDVLKKIPAFIETDQICYLQEHEVEFIEKNDNKKFKIKEVFEHMKEQFNLELKSSDLLYIYPNSKENYQKMYEYIANLV